MLIYCFLLTLVNINLFKWQIPSDYRSKVVRVYELKYQVTPHPSESPTRNTKVYFFQDEANLYFIFECEIKGQEDLIKRFSLRDALDGDEVRVYISPDVDKSEGYRFGVSAMNIQEDAYSNDNGEYWNKEWDGIWYSDVKLSDSLYFVGFKIPLKNFLYSKSSRWGVNFKRVMDKTGEVDSYVEFHPGEREKITDYAVLPYEETGYRWHNLKIFPSFAVRRYDEEEEVSYTPWIGGDVLYKPSSYLNIGVTVHPDFSEIEADPYTINISKQRTYYTEKREFFLEGVDIFNTPVANIYTRNIGRKLYTGEVVPVNFGFKSLYTGNKVEFGLLTAYTGEVREDTAILEGSAFYNFGRVLFLPSSSFKIGAFYGEKRDSVGEENIKTIDAYWYGDRIWVKSQYSRDYNRNNLFYIDISYKSGGKGISFTTEYSDDDFSVNRISYYYPERSACLSMWRERWNQGIFMRSCWEINMSYTKEPYEDKPSYSLSILNNPIFKNMWMGVLTVGVSKDFEQGKEFTSYDIFGYLSTDFSKKLAGGFNVRWISKTFDYASWNFAESYMLAPFITYNIQKFKVQTSVTGYRLRNLETNGIYSYKAYRASCDYFFNKDLYLRLFFTGNWDSNENTLNAMLSYNFMPGSYFYFVINSNFERDGLNIKLENNIVALKLKILLWL